MVRSHLSLRTRILAPVILVGAFATAIALSIVYTVQRDVESDVLGELSALSDLHVAHSFYTAKVYRRVIDFWEIDIERLKKAGDDMNLAIETFVKISSRQAENGSGLLSRENTNTALKSGFQTMIKLGQDVFNEAENLSSLTEEMEDTEQEWRKRVAEFDIFTSKNLSNSNAKDLFSHFEEMIGHVFDYFSETREYVDDPNAATLEEIDEALDGFQRKIETISKLLEQDFVFLGATAHFESSVDTIDKIVEVSSTLRASRVFLQGLVAQHQESSEKFDQTIQDAIGLVSHDAQHTVSHGFTTIALLIVLASAVSTLTIFVPLTRAVRRLSRLNDTAQAFGAGDFSARGKIQQNDEVGQFTATFNTMADQLEHSFSEQRLLQEKAELANRAKSDFLASMSHELRTPLNAIAGFTNIMRMGIFGEIESERYKKYLTDIQYSAEHVIEMIGDLLELARAEGGHRTLHPESLKAQEVGQLVSDLCSKNLSDASVTLALDLDPDHSLEADRRALIQMLLNLITNAVKFSKESNEVVLRSVDQEDYLIFEVVDQGVGIPEDQLETVLSPYFQTENPMVANSGVGLGLALTRELVELHNGSIILESKLGFGTTARIKLPKVFSSVETIWIEEYPTNKAAE